MNQAIGTIWSPLSTTPLLWLGVTIFAYWLGCRIQRNCRGSPFASPVLFCILSFGALLLATHTPYDTYLAGAQFIHFLLGPATVSLAVPLARNLAHVSRSLRAVMLALLVGLVTSVVSGVAIVWALGGSRTISLSIAPKAVTTPIAMVVSTEIGGIPALTASFAILGGVLAAVRGYAMLKWFRIHDWRAHGLAAG